jgi:predicted phosphodiesterase
MIFLRLLLAMHIALLFIPFNQMLEAQPANKVVFAAAGDWDCTENTLSTISAIQLQEVDIVLALGDLAYTQTANCWFNISSPIDDKIRFVLGNHDDESQAKYEQYMSHYGLSLPYYSFDIENVHFLVLSTEPSCDTCPFVTSDPQYAFASEDLLKTARNPDIDWIVASMHKPLYTNLHAGHNDYNVFKRVYQPLFDKYAVDLVLAGHVHNYQRTPPLTYNSASPSNPIVTDTSDLRTFNDPDGQVYIVISAQAVVLWHFIRKQNLTWRPMKKIIMDSC